MDNTSLQHYGVLGMKWGVRKASYNSSSSKRKLKRKKNSSDDNEKKLSVEERKAKILKSRSAKELYKNADLFTTQELQSAYNRLVLERNISSLSPKEVSKGHQFIDKSVSVGKTIDEVAKVGTSVYNHAARVYNTFYSDGKSKWPVIKDNDGKKKDK